MLAVAIRTVRSVADSGFERLAVHAFAELPRHLFMTLRAGACDLPMAHRRLRIARGENAVAAMTIRADRGVFALQHRPSVNALQILLYRMKHWNFVARQEFLAGVALRATERLILLCDF